MTSKSQIEWTEHSWNPAVGCTKVSAVSIATQKLWQIQHLWEQKAMKMDLDWFDAR